MKKLLEKKKGNKKGFTLVEVIVVLVILAILAAVLIPSLVGYIDKANKRAVIAEARSAVLAAQTLASEDYAEKPTVDTCTSANIATLAEVKAENVGTPTVANGKVTKLTYTANGYTVTYENGAYKTAPASK